MTAAKPKPAKKPARKAAGKAKAKAKAKGRGSKPCPRQRRITAHRLTWRGATLAIKYEADRFAGQAHLEIHLLAPRGVPLPITDTGFRSHFLDASLVKEAGGPAAYVRQWLEREARSPAYLRALERWRQLDLFSEPAAP